MNDIAIRFPGLRRMKTESPELGIAAINIEMQLLFDVLADVGIYDDPPDCLRLGNALSAQARLLPRFIGAPEDKSVVGTILLGSRFLESIKDSQYQTAILCAVMAHEFGHMLQFKHMSVEQRESIGARDGNNVRLELFSDFVCGYYTGVKFSRQADFPGVIPTFVQWRYGDVIFRQHHGTPQERGNSTQNGFALGQKGVISPSTLVDLALQYVKGITLEKVSGLCDPTTSP